MESEVLLDLSRILETADVLRRNDAISRDTLTQISPLHSAHTTAVHNCLIEDLTVVGGSTWQVVNRREFRKYGCFLR